MSEVFKRTMLVRRPSRDVYLLGSREDPNPEFREVLQNYEEIRLASPHFKGAIFELLEDGLLFRKTELWNNEEDYQKFISENRAYIRSIVSAYEEYNATVGITVQRLGEMTTVDQLNSLEREVYESRVITRHQPINSTN